MQTPMKFAPMIVLTLGTLAAGDLPAQGLEAGDWLLRARGIVVSPNDDSSVVTAGGAAVAGSGVSVNDDIVPEIDFTYMLTPNWGLELILATSEHDATAQGTLAGLGKVVEADVLPPTLTLQYHFAPQSNLRPYVGVGVNYTIFYDEQVTGGLAAAGADVDLDSSFGIAGQAGIDIDLGNNWFINFDVKYIMMDTEAEITGSAVGAAAVDIDIDPFVFGAGVGYRF